jgi:hypothetical protein
MSLNFHDAEQTIPISWRNQDKVSGFSWRKANDSECFSFLSQWRRTTCRRTAEIVSEVSARNLASSKHKFQSGSGEDLCITASSSWIIQMARTSATVAIRIRPSLLDCHLLSLSAPRESAWTQGQMSTERSEHQILVAFGVIGPVLLHWS